MDIEKRNIKMSIQFGLVNHEDKYLTAETFGNLISVTGTSLKAKQTWTFVQEVDGAANKGYLISPQNRYLETNKNGNVTCEAEEKDEAYLFEVVISDNGKWAFKDSFGKYFSGNSERLYTLMSVNLIDEILWCVHYAGHPQCNLKSVARKQYVHLQDEELRANEDVPWGKDAVLTLEFCKGLYGIRSADGDYLNGVTGELNPELTEESKFILSIKENHFAFKSIVNKKFLSVYGHKGKLIATKGNIGKDEVFAMEESRAQCVIVANNGKKVSVRQGIDVTANQFMEPGDSELFQLDYHLGRKEKATFISANKKYWVSTDKSVTSSADKIAPNGVFELEWHDGKVAFKTSNGKYISSSSGGQLTPASDSPTDPQALFTLTLVNRPIIVIRGEHGYIGEISSSNKLQSNRGIPNTIHVLHEFDGRYRLKMKSGKFCSLAEDKFIVISENDGEYFTFELYGKNQMLIRASNGNLLTSDHNGTITAKTESVTKNALWGY